MVSVMMCLLLQNVCPAAIARCSTIGPSASAGKKVSPPTIRTTPTSRPTNSAPSVGKVPCEACSVFLPASAAGDRQHRHDDEEAADEHRERQGQVVEGGVAGEPGEGAAVVGGGRGEGVEHLAEAVRAGVLDARGRRRAGRRRSP